MVERLVSLAPSVTNTLGAVGAADRVVGRTEHGSGPGTVVGGWLTPDRETIARLEPDLVLTADPLQAELAEDLEAHGFHVAHHEPTTLDDVLETIRSIGAAVGNANEATELVRDLEARMDAVRDRVAGRPRPTVYCEEWSEPPMVAGNWVPEAVRVAGGHYPWVDPGERSQRIDRETVEAVDPEHVVLHICGRGVAVDPDLLAERGWSLTAIEAGCVTVLADRYLNQPAPQLIDGIERLAGILHPEEVRETPEQVAESRR